MTKDSDVWEKPISRTGKLEIETTKKIFYRE